MEAPNAAPWYLGLPTEAGSAGLKVYQLGFYAPGLRLWWVLGCWVEGYMVVQAKGQISTLIQGYWACWSRWLTPFLPVPLALRRGIDKSGRDRAWSRCLLEQTVSTSGLLVWLTCTTARSHLYAPGAFCALERFLERMMSQLDFELEVPLDEAVAKAFVFAGNRCNPEVTAKLPVDSHWIWVQPFLAQSDGPERAHLREFFSRLAVAGFVPGGRVHMARLLVELCKATAMQWLCRAMCLSLAIWVEEGWKDCDKSDNPLFVDCAFGGREDHHRAQLLVQGGGQDSSADRSTFPEAHAAAYRRLRKPHRRWSKKGPKLAFSLAKQRGCMLVRYLQACKDHLSRCTSLSVCLDASRVSGKDYLLVVVIGTNPEGETLACWAPPQVLASVVMPSRPPLRVEATRFCALVARPPPQMPHPNHQRVDMRCSNTCQSAGHGGGGCDSVVCMAQPTVSNGLP